MVRRAKLGASLLVFAIALWPTLTSAAKPPMVDMPAPNIVSPIIVNGTGVFNLRAQRGHGVYLNFFASWCQPCKEEARTLEKVTREFADRNVTILGVAVLDNSKDARAFVHGYDLSYGIVIDESGGIGTAYRVNRLPLHVFIGSDGKIKQYVPGGPIPESELRAGLNEIAK